MIKTASWKAFGASAMMSLPPGAIGYATIIPELISITKIQIDLIHQIAAYYGKLDEAKNPKILLLIIANAGGVETVKNLYEKIGANYLIKALGTEVVKDLAKKIGINLTQNAISKLVGRWIPIAMSPIFGYYSKKLTEKTGKCAIELFSNTIIDEKNKSTRN